MFAAGSNSDELFDLLIRYKADPNKVGWIGVAHSALTLALTEGRNLGDKRFKRADCTATLSVTIRAIPPGGGR
jgi:hypothetical protein